MSLLDPYSFTTVPIEMFFDETALGKATSFIWQEGQNYFLVTNWHNVTGINPNSGENISPTGGRPNRIEAYFNEKGYLGRKFCMSLALYDENGGAVWMIHPSLGNSVDAVALPLDLPREPEWFAINRLSEDDLAVHVGHEVFILGYPYGFQSPGLPVWKRASIASEPGIYLNGIQYTLVDTASRPGMSGSPVIRRSWGAHMFANGAVATGPGVYTTFFGIYSGRLNTRDALDAQLGIVWRSKLISEIVSGCVRDEPL